MRSTPFIVHAAAFAGLAFAGTAVADAIIMRHDVPDARYRDFGEQYRSYLVQVALPGSAPGSTPNLVNGVGTLIAPRWVITAAHVAERLQPGHPEAIDLRNHFVYVNGRGYRVAKAFVHPRYAAPGVDSQSPDAILADDIALLQLDREVKDGRIACLHDKDDELGKPIILAGMGLPGNGSAGVGKQDGALRGATVRVDSVTPAVISWTFRPPTDPKSTALEGISGPGDSGGPAFIDRGGELCIAGISSTQNTKGGPQGLYGVTEHYARVSSHIDWLRKVMRDNP